MINDMKINLPNKGSIVASGIIPSSDFASHYAGYGRGGYRSVNTLEELYSIVEDRLEVGMLVYVIEEDKTYQYKILKLRDEDGNLVPETDDLGNPLYDDNGEIIYKTILRWVEAKFAGEGGTGGNNGIPIYDKEMLEELDISDDEKYISVRTEGELDDIPEGDTIKINNDGSYLNILFSAIRQLQLEVARLRNSFRYGICSYTGTNTSMSETLEDLNTVPEEEPLWAVEPDGLSAILGSEINTNTPNLTENSFYTIDGDLIRAVNSTWIDKELLINFTKDPKIFLFSTFIFNDQNKDTKDSEYNITLAKVVESEELENRELDESGNIIFDESELVSIKIKDINKNIAPVYNLQVIISRKQEIDGNTVGENFIWVSISDYVNKTTLVEGYYNPETQEIVNQKISLEEKYTFSNIQFKNTSLKYVDFYSKYQDFSKDIIPSKPEDDQYKYRVAHLTIRSVSTNDELQNIKDQLLENELIFTEDSRSLWIKNNYDLIKIGAQNNNNNDIVMNKDQLIDLLKEAGIISYNENDNSFELTNISDITFIHQDSGKTFKFSPNSLGELESIELPKVSLEKRLDKIRYNSQLEISTGTNENDTTGNVRGFVALLNCSENNGNFNSLTADQVLNSDRVKISAIYSPLSTDTIFGCSHAYIELENTSDIDFDLTGCYLHYSYNNGVDEDKVTMSLKLKGKIPAGSTYLIRGKKYSDPKLSPNTFINVDDFDIEWWYKDPITGENKLVDLTRTVKSNNTYLSTKGYSFALTYGDIPKNDVLVIQNINTNTKSDFPYYWNKCYIDSIVINTSDTIPSWLPVSGILKQIQPNSIIKNTFALDPAKQAFNGLNKIDSSRHRGQNPGNDIQILNLDNEYIKFPNSEEIYPVSKFTPRSSKYNKNILTDKTKPDYNKPNSVYVSFGKDVYTTRCFNWVSISNYDEFVFIKSVSGDGEVTWESFESYKTIDEKIINNSDTYPKRKEFDVDINNTIYSRLHNIFPVNNVPNSGGITYTSHKCILQLTSSAVSNKTEYTYVVGRRLPDGTPDFEHCSDEMKFTLYPTTYEPRIYHITDQQGFHWVEYQAWAASANKLNDIIKSECEKDNIMPILINTGDVTQNGTRINEWLDYYNAGKCLFNHLEHMSVVGNNDLVDTDITKLGTGNDIGKSNGYFFQVFNCYEVDENIKPIINGKYVPSLYYFDCQHGDSKKYRFLMCNSEITVTNCRDWFGLVNGNNIYNIYTGWKIRTSGDLDEYKTGLNFTSIYEMIYNIMESSGEREIIAACHELPFTVLTKDSLKKSEVNKSRSIDSKLGLVGSHLNQISHEDTCKKGLYWFSRLCEHFKVKLVLGGHKHTYTSTFPVREYYKYVVDQETKNSKDNGPMIMSNTLEFDTVDFDFGTFNGSKKPITYKTDVFPLEDDSIDTQDSFYPATKPEDTDSYKENSVVYFMCQATGYKQTSNKELPSNDQRFSALIPETTVKNKADDNQKYPMAVIVKLNKLNTENDNKSIISINSGENHNHYISLIRFKHVMKENDYVFNQLNYGSGDIIANYIIPNDTDRYGNWGGTEDSDNNYEDVKQDRN